MACCPPPTADPGAMAAAVKVQLPISEVQLPVPDTPEGWDDLAAPLADVLCRGDIPTEIDSAKLAIMHLKTRAPAKYSAIMSQVIKLGALEALINRIQAPVPSAVPPQSIWWREICQSRFSDCQILSIFCHSLDLVAALRPYRALILKAIKFLLVSPHFRHIYSIRFLAAEIVISLVVLAPDFDTFVFLHKEGVFPILCDLISSSTDNDKEKHDWVVYDLGSPATPLCVQSICITIFAYVMSECNVVSRGNAPTGEEKSILSDLENLPLFINAVNAIRNHCSSASPRYIVDSLQHLTMLFFFGGRSQCIQREHLTWVDEAAQFLSDLPDNLAAISEPADDNSRAFYDRIRTDCDFILSLIRERHEPNKILSRSRLPDLRQKFRGSAAQRSSPVINSSSAAGASAESSPQKPSCQVCKSQAELKRCQRCLSVLYCSRECQVSDWKNHKTQCNKR